MANPQEWLTTALSVPQVNTAARRTADWLDLELSSLVSALRALAPRTRGRLLDVGCGEKPHEHIFRPYVDDYVGVEYGDTYAQTNASKKPGKADVIYDGKHLPFADREFDVVLSIQVLEHTLEPGELVREMARVMKDDGLLILSAPFSFRLHEEPHDYYRYSPHALTHLCEAAGLRVSEMSARGGLFTVIGHKLNSYLALNIARIDGIAQALGKLGHEKTAVRPTRYWALPWVAPAMAGIALGARVLDRVLPDPTETLGFILVARRA